MARKVSRRKPHRSLLNLIPRHGAFPPALAAGVIASVITFFLARDYALPIGANVVFLVHLMLVAIELPRMTPEYLRQHANDENVPVVLIMVITLAIVAVAVVSLFLALNGGGKADPVQVVLGVISVFLGWFVIHTMAALHYAYEFYESPDGKPSAGRAAKREIAGGLEWPEGDEPNGIAFLYLSYQNGAALQLADVRATTNRMRRLLLVHSSFSFFYNTLLVAAAVNIVISAGGS